MHVVSLALVVILQGSLPPGPAEVNRPVTEVNRTGVLTSYDDAYHRAGQEGKPIFVLFTTQAQPAELKQLQSQGLLNDYLVVVADRNTEAGRKVFAEFNWQSLRGVSVIERNRQWQFARYERKLSGDELARVASACRGASGHPTVDVLASDVAAYPPPVQGQQQFQLSQQVQPSMPLGGYPEFQPQFQPMPMFGGFGGFGGGCASGH